MNAVLWVHIASGLVALVAGTLAVMARKGGRGHASAGKWFALSMFVLGFTAAVLAQAKADAGTGLGGLLTCYFVATSWATARRRDGVTGKFEIAACAAVLAAAASVALAAYWGTASTPAGKGPLFAFAAVCLLAGVGDLKAVLRKKQSAAQRLSRHLWRMCFAFFMATGSFFIGQQDSMPDWVRGSPLLLVLGFSPLAIMAYWLVRLRYAKMIGRITLRPSFAAAGAPGWSPPAGPATEISHGS
jgi:uncharacterized membrane protein